MKLPKPSGRRLVVLRVLQMICLVTTPIVVARFLFSDVVWLVALVAGLVALTGVVLLYRTTDDGVDRSHNISKGQARE